jgi:hypothetical protein
VRERLIGGFDAIDWNFHSLGLVAPPYTSYIPTTSRPFGLELAIYPCCIAE